MKKLNLFLIGILIIALTGCGGSSVDKAISQVDKAIEKIEKKKGSMTEEDWNNAQKEVEAPLKVIADALDNNKVGALTKIKIIATTAKWAAVVSEAGMNEMGKRMGELGKGLEGATKELENAAKELNKTTTDTATVAPAANDK